MIRVGLRWSAIILAIMCIVSVYAWMLLPDGAQVPVHWDAAGEVDRYGGKFEALLMMPLVAIFLIALLAFLPKIDPRKINLEKSKAAYLAGWLGTLTVLAAMHLLTIYTALGGDAPVAKIGFAMIGLLFAVLGNYIAKTRSNWFVGLRTPWTLSSEQAWTVGNRYLGRGMVVTGILIIFAAIGSNMMAVIILSLVGIIASAVIATIASYYVWKNDPDARSKS